MAEGPVKSNSPQYGKSPTYVGYVFGRATVGLIQSSEAPLYFRTFDPSVKEPSETTGIWKKIPAIEDIDGFYDIIGACTYKRTIYLFLGKKDSIKGGRWEYDDIGFIKYEINEGNWGSFKQIKKPKNQGSNSDVDTIIDDVVVVQSYGTSETPKIIIKAIYRVLYEKDGQQKVTIFYETSLISLAEEEPPDPETYTLLDFGGTYWGQTDYWLSENAYEKNSEAWKKAEVRREPGSFEKNSLVQTTALIGAVHQKKSYYSSNPQSSIPNYSDVPAYFIVTDDYWSMEVPEKFRNRRKADFTYGGPERGLSPTPGRYKKGVKDPPYGEFSSRPDIVCWTNKNEILLSNGDRIVASETAEPHLEENADTWWDISGNPDFVVYNNAISGLPLGGVQRVADAVFMRKTITKQLDLSHQVHRLEKVEDTYKPHQTLALSPVVVGLLSTESDYRLDNPVWGITPKDLQDGIRVQRQASTTEDVFKMNNTPVQQATMIYIEEAYFHLPVFLARQLMKTGNYEAALSWFRIVYDYVAEEGDRKIWHGLRQDGKGPTELSSNTEGLIDRINPHSIAESRPNKGTKYTQFTLFSIVQCLLDYADEEFTQDTGGSIQRARTLYETALDLLETEELKQLRHPCDKLTVKIKEKIYKKIKLGGEDDDENDDKIGRSLGREVDRINDTEILRKLEKTLQEMDFDEESRSERIKHISDALRVIKDENTPLPKVTTFLKNNTEAERTAFQSLMANDDVARSTSKTATTTLSLTVGANDTSNSIYVPEWQTVSLSFCIPANPVLKSLRQRAKLNLEKIRTCRNFAGMKRELEPYVAPSGVESAAPSMGGDGAAGTARQTSIQPTDYRYDTLIARTKELVNLAQKIETSFLSAIESRDSEAYKLLQARQDIDLVHAGVRLQELRVRKAQDRVGLTQLQKEKAQLRVSEYQQMIEAGLNRWEERMIDQYRRAASEQIEAISKGTEIQLTRLITSMGSSDPISAAFGAVNTFVSLGDVESRGYARQAAARARTRARIASVRASFHRRKKQWQMQKAIAQQDARIRSQQIDIAEANIDVVRQQHDIAEIEVDHAEETIEFLQDEQFTNVELFDWMANVFEGVYRYFLQQATSMANLAERQLAFERQELPQQFIESGYWRVSREGQTTVDGEEETPDRRGLTGSARLLRDIYQLDQYAFRTDERKQQVSKTISLAQLAPFELQQFRETGVLTFDTSQELFDLDYPGQYLRLIKNVSVSVIALTPPTDGIKAELINSGISRVVTGGPPFRTEVIRRDTEMITLSSPQNETGVFQLRPEGEMLNPFEKRGVDTSWELRMPRAANAFDYDSIADVLLTINYTALQSNTYRQQVIKGLDPEQSGQRAFSFSDEFADPWYDLHNPLQADEPMTVRFKTRRADFPTNLNDVKIENVLLYYVTKDGVDTKEIKTTLEFDPEDEQGTVGGEATPVEQRISTRRGNGSPWVPMIGKSVAGKWKLSLPNSTQVKRMFDEEKIEDMLFVITYEGRTPAWS